MLVFKKVNIIPSIIKRNPFFLYSRIFKKQIPLQTIYYQSTNYPLIFRFGSNQTFTQQNFEDIKQKYAIPIDSITLFNQFKENIQKTENMKISNQISQYYLGILKSRMENELCLQVIDIVIGLCQNKFNKPEDNSILYFMGQSVVLNYELGRLTESKNKVLSLLQLYQRIKEKQNPLNLIKYTKYLANSLVKVNQIEHAIMFINDAIQYLENNVQVQLPNSELFEIYNIYSGCNFLKGNFEASAKYGLLSYEQVKDNPYNIHNPQYSLIGVYISYKELKQQDKCQQILEELNKYPQVLEDINIEELQGSTYRPFSFKHIPTQEAKKLEELEEINEQLDKSVSVFFEGYDETFQNFIKEKQFQQGIEYYKNILNQLDPVIDVRKRIQINDKIASLYNHFDGSENLDQAIQICLDSHQILLKLRKYYLFYDNITYQNLTSIKRYYFQKSDFQKSVEWGSKWYTYCQTYRLFDVYNKTIIDNLFMHSISLSHLGNFQQALDFTKIIIQYLDQSKVVDKQFNDQLIELQSQLDLKLNNVENANQATKKE